MSRAAAALAAILVGTAAAAPTLEPDPPKICSACAAWNEPLDPFRIFGNTYYVGTTELTSILVASRDGLILLDGALPQSAPLIAANIHALGFRLEDIRFIVNSHTHFDHAGGIAALQRASGAVVAASPASAVALRQGGLVEDDPQYGFGRDSTAFPPVANVRVIGDGEILRVGELAITARFTPGHTPGGTTWTWRSCEAERCLEIVYADSLNSVSAPGFRYTGDSNTESRVQSFEQSIARVGGLPCDILLAPHPGSFDREAKQRKRRQQPNVNPFFDPRGCETYARDARRNLQQRVESERASSGTEARHSH